MFMRKALLRFMCVSALVCVALVAQASAQDFQKSYPLTAGGSVSIQNVSGNVQIIGYGGEAVTVTAYREGRDRELVEVEDKSSANSVRLGVRYPRNCNCDASVRFEVRVPRAVRYQISPVQTASGNVEVRDVTGEVKVSTASGNVLVSGVSGSVNAQSASGNVDVELTRLEGAENMRFSTASGDVNVKLPDNPDAYVSMSTASGSVRTDFPIEVDKREHGPGQSARGQLGNGTVRVSLSSASGNVTLSRL
jgi:hypothetical protein